MWFIKTSHLVEFQEVLDSIGQDGIKKKIIAIRATEEFCKAGKGISFYNKTIINNKLAKEIEKYLNDDNYKVVEIKDFNLSL